MKLIKVRKRCKKTIDGWKKVEVLAEGRMSLGNGGNGDLQLEIVGHDEDRGRAVGLPYRITITAFEAQRIARVATEKVATLVRACEEAEALLEGLCDGAPDASPLSKQASHVTLVLQQAIAEGRVQ